MIPGAFDLGTAAHLAALAHTPREDARKALLSRALDLYLRGLRRLAG